MLDLLQIGVPGGMELAILLLLVVPILAGYWVSKDTKKRGSDHHIAWGVMTFLFGLGYVVPLIVWGIFYYFVRNDIGEPA